MGDIGSDLNFVLNQQPEPTQALPGLQEALVLSADTNGLFVTIPQFHPDWSFGPCRYSWPIQGYPPVNSGCLVGFVGDDLTRPYVAAWADAPRTPLRLDGAPAETRYVGGTTSGAPTSGAFRVGDFVVDQTGVVWMCTVAGSPGTWRSSQDKPTGDIEPCLAIKANQLLLDGSLVSRTTYARLFQWATAKGFVGAAPGQPFGVGDGSTTFQLPDFRGRVPVGVGTLGTDAYTLGVLGGTAHPVLTVAQLPGHKHNVAVANHGAHNHPLTGGTVPGGGDHGGHFPGAQVITAAGPDYGVSPWNSGGVGSGSHGHGAVAVFSDNVNLSAHTVTEDTIGTASPLDNRPPYIGIQWAIWL